MKELVEGSREDRAAIFRSTAQSRSVGATLIEKDFWACWTLQLLFTPDAYGEMVFKGGTSLSKAYSAITRFSEDLDLTLPMGVVPGITADMFTAVMSRSERDSALRKTQSALVAWAIGEATGGLRARVRDALPATLRRQVRVTAVTPPALGEPGTILLRYPRSLDKVQYTQARYVRDEIRMEFGARNPTTPFESGIVAPYCTPSNHIGSPAWSARVRVLGIERTFWEKATAIHSLNTRGLPGRAEGQSRHFADLAELLKHPRGAAAAADLAMLNQVAEDKSRLFHSPSSRYDLAQRGQLSLVPNPEGAEWLRRDYELTKTMYFETPPSLEEIIDRLADLEARVFAATR